VIRGLITPQRAWPEFFLPDEGDDAVFPSTESDMSAFTLEKATPESFAADMAALVAASSQVVIREPSLQPGDRDHVPDTEWT
jgi:hypothetical protein